MCRQAIGYRDNGMVDADDLYITKEIRQKKLLKAVHSQNMDTFSDLMNGDGVDKIITAEHLELAKKILNELSGSKDYQNSIATKESEDLAKAKRIYSDLLKKSGTKVLEEVEAGTNEISRGIDGLAKDAKVSLLPKRLLNAIEDQDIEAVKLYANPSENSPTKINALIDDKHITLAAEKFIQEKAANNRGSEASDKAEQIFKILIPVTRTSVLEALSSKSTLDYSAKALIESAFKIREKKRPMHILDWATNISYAGGVGR